MPTGWHHARWDGELMKAFDTSLSRGPMAVGLKLGVVFLVLLVVVGAWAGAYWWAKSTGRLKQVEHVVGQMDYQWPSWMSKGAKKATYQEPTPEVNHVAFDPRDEQLRRMQREIDELRNRKPAATQTKVATPPVKRGSMVVLNHERKAEGISLAEDLMLAPGTFIQGTLQTILNSEVEGFFTIKTSRPVFDSVTHQHVVIPQGQSIVAKDTSSALVFGNERIPTFAVTLSLPGDRSVDLGDAPVMDVTGTNGLTGIVDNHVWRLVWTSVFIGGLRGGQQLLQQSLTGDDTGAIASGIVQQGSQVSQQRLGRAQDTRPTIIAEAGQIVNVLVTRAIRIPATTMANR
jgi:type IV secretory pathway VirB10-like protein